MEDRPIDATKRLKVRYYLTLVAETELEILAGDNIEKAVRDALPDLPEHVFHVLTADYAEVEGEDQRARCIKLA